MMDDLIRQLPDGFASVLRFLLSVLVVAPVAAALTAAGWEERLKKSSWKDKTLVVVGVLILWMIVWWISTATA